MPGKRNDLVERSGSGLSERRRAMLLETKRKGKRPRASERGDHPRFRGKSRLARGRKVRRNIADTLFTIVNRAPSVG